MDTDTPSAFDTPLLPGEELDTTVVCRQCRRLLRINYGAALRAQWPWCCGRPMRVRQVPDDVARRVVYEERSE